MDDFFEKNESKIYFILGVIILSAVYFSSQRAEEQLDFSTINVFVEHRKYGPALDFIQKRQLKKKSFEACLLSAVIYLDMGLHKDKKTLSQGLDDMASVISRDTDYGTYGGLSTDKFYVLAFDSAKNAHALKNHDPESLTLMAVISLLRGALSDSKEYMTSAIRDSIDSVQKARCLTVMAFFYELCLRDSFDQELYDEAIKCIKSAVRYDSQNAKSQEVYGDILSLRTISAKEASEHYQKALENWNMVKPGIIVKTQEGFMLNLLGPVVPSEIKRKIFLTK